MATTEPVGREFEEDDEDDPCKPAAEVQLVKPTPVVDEAQGKQTLLPVPSWYVPVTQSVQRLDPVVPE